MDSLLNEVPINSWELLGHLTGEVRPEAELPAEEGRDGGLEEEEDNEEEEDDRSRGTVWSASQDL